MMCDRDPPWDFQKLRFANGSLRRVGWVAEKHWRRRQYTNAGSVRSAYELIDPSLLAYCTFQGCARRRKSSKAYGNDDTRNTMMVDVGGETGGPAQRPYLLLLSQWKVPCRQHERHLVPHVVRKCAAGRRVTWCAHLTAVPARWPSGTSNAMPHLQYRIRAEPHHRRPASPSTP